MFSSFKFDAKTYFDNSSSCVTQFHNYHLSTCGEMNYWLWRTN